MCIKKFPNNNRYNVKLLELKNHNFYDRPIGLSKQEELEHSILLLFHRNVILLFSIQICPDNLNCYLLPSSEQLPTPPNGIYKSFNKT